MESPRWFRRARDLEVVLGLAIMGVAALVAIRATAAMLATTPLMFEWDDWTILVGMRSGPAWLLQEHVGHFFPLGRAVYWLETRAFGFDYRGYVWVNLALLIATSCVLMQVFARMIRNVPLSACLAGLYLVGHGQYVNVTWALQVVWFLEAFLTALLLRRVVDLRTPLLSPTNLVLVFLVWLSFASAVVAIPFLVIVARVFAYRFAGVEVPTFDLRGFALLLVLAFGLVIGGRTIISHFPPPHVGAHAFPIELRERLSNLPEIAGDAMISFGFYGTAPVVPGALSAYSQRTSWDNFLTWLMPQPGLFWILVGLVLTIIGIAGWRASRPDAAASSVSLWIVAGAVALGLPIAATAVARTALFGAARTPRYDTFLVLSSLLAVTALLAVPEPFRRDPSQGRMVALRGQRRRWLAATAIVVHLGWLLLFLPWNMKVVTAWRVRRTTAWQALAARCAKAGDESGPLVIPPELQPQLTAGQFCEVVARLRRGD